MSEERNEPTFVEGMPITRVLSAVVQQVRIAIAETGDQSMAVDVSIDLRQVAITKGGVPIFAPKTTEQTMEVRLAFRVRAEDFDATAQTRLSEVAASPDPAAPAAGAVATDRQGPPAGGRR